MANPSGLPGLSGSYRLMSHFTYEPVALPAFFGGMSIDRKLGTKAPQFYYGRHIDFRKNPSQFTVLPYGSAENSGAVVDLVLDMAQITTGEKYAVGSAGNVYHVSAAGVWSSYGAIGETGGAGIAYRSDVDHTYLTGQTVIARIKRTTASPSWQPTWFTKGVSSASTCYKTGGGNTYTVPTAVNESSTNMRKFTSDIEPLVQIGVKILAKGTGNWTLTLHNDANDVLATVTIAIGSVKANTINYFVFSAPIRIQRGDHGAGAALTYHYHLTSTVADGTVATTTQASLADCDMELWASALVDSVNDLHPIINFLNFTLIGNSNYVAQYEPLQDNPQMNIDYSPHRLTFPPGFEVTSFAQQNLLCVIGCEKRSSSGEFQEGALFFWDGIADTYNDWWPVPEGAPESLFSHKNLVYFFAGGALYEVTGVNTVTKLRTMRGTDSEFSNIADTTHVYPKMMTVRRGTLLIGYPSYTTNQSLEHAVFSLGQTASVYPVSFGLSYTISTGSVLNNGSNNLKIGMIKNLGDTLYISWRDDSASPTHYGIDITDNTSPPKSNARIESLLYDGNRPASYKKVGWLMAISDTLPAGVTYKLKYKLDREANWHYSDDTDKTNIAIAGSTVFLWPLDLRFLALEYGMDITIDTTVDTSTTPAIRFVGAYIDPQILEKPIGAGGS